MALGLTCKVCGHWEERNLNRHLKSSHSLSTKEYKKLYPGNKTMTGHSKRTVDYWQNLGYSLEEGYLKVKEFQKSNNQQFYKSRQEKGISEEDIRAEMHTISITRSVRRPEFFTSRGFSEEEAKKMVFDRQAILSGRSTKFAGHRHTEESKQKISIRTKELIAAEGVENRIAHFYVGKEQHRSAGEIKCFQLLREYYPTLEANCRVCSKVVDMKLDNIVIEYYGDFWHRNPKIYKKEHDRKVYTSERAWERDGKRIEEFIQSGYRAFIIWEHDWHHKQEEVIHNLKQFIDGSADKNY